MTTPATRPRSVGMIGVAAGLSAIALATVMCQRVEPGSAGAESPALGSSRCELPETYVFSHVGGMVPSRARYTLEPPNRFSMIREFFLDERPDLRCTGTLPTCEAPGSEAVSVETLNRHLADAAVAEAWPDSGVRLLGWDARPVDGSLLEVTRSESDTLQIGSACRDAADCIPIPPEVEALGGVLGRLAEQISSSAACTEPDS